jgi:tetratricopeptide (TPR) repeat protein
MPPGRNETCPCGSGRKYKHCCGAPPRDAPARAQPQPAAAPPWALLEAGRPAQAEAECERLLAQQPAHGLAWKCLGIARHTQGKDALAALEAAGRALPEDAEVHCLLGHVLEDRGLDARAAECFSRATGLRPAFADAHNDLGRVLLRLGRTDAAIASCRRALALRPNFAAAIGNLANADRARGDLAAAISGYRRVLELEPRMAEAHHHLGSALAEAGEQDAAIDCFRLALELRPDYASAVARLARALTAAGRAVEAIPYYEHLLARTPTAQTLEGFATVLAGLGRFEAAARRFREALALAPSARLHSNLGYMLHCIGDFQGAIRHCRHAIELDPGLAEAHLHLGNALLAVGELHSAANCYGAGIEVDPGHAALHSALGMAQRALGRLDAAEASARRALELNPGAADTLAFLGSLAGDRGRFAEAETLLRAARSIAPELPEALVGLSRIRRMTTADVEWREATERVLGRGLPLGHTINLHHAAGKYYDDVGNYEAAFRHHRLGNELARRTGPRYDRAATARRVTQTITAFDRGALDALRQATPASERSVFVVGMPRSGTTLAEQILASHPDVHGADELVYWNFAADVERASPSELRAATIAKLGRDYLALLSAQSPDASRVVDKLPGNFEHVGLIHAALPAARFIHLERHPLDTGLSIYFQGFATAHAYATDLSDLAHYYREYRRLMAHWHATLPPGVILDVPYEALVEDPEGWSRRMLAHVGLPWDPRCLDFHRTERAVLTASGWQVRQPISRGSLDRWRLYERFLGPLREALGDALVRHRG